MQKVEMHLSDCTVFMVVYGLSTVLNYCLDEIRLSTARTCLTLCSTKACCTTAVELVHSICTGPVVLTGMTCAVIDVCFRIEDEKSVEKWKWSMIYLREF